jgi:hypothetical protein
MNRMMKLWLLGMGIPPEDVEADEKFLHQIKIGEELGAWQRLQEMRYQKHLNTYPEFDTPNAQLEFMSIVAGKPQLWM